MAMKSIFNGIKDFLKAPFNQYLTLALTVLAIYLLFFQPATFSAPSQAQGDGNITINFFFSPSCSHCAAQKVFHQKLLADQEFKNLKIISYNADVPENMRLMQGMSANFTTIPPEGIPVTFIGNYKMFVGYDDEEHRGADIKEALRKCALSGCKTQDPNAPASNPLSNLQVPVIGTIDLSSTSLLIVASVLGLIDGFNPCAMWVLVYLISLTMSITSTKRKWLIVATFLLASGILYFLFMTAWLNAFLIIGYFRPISILVGAFALGVGILSIKEYVDTKGSISCKVETPSDKKKLMDEMKQIVSSPLNLATIAGIIVLAFVINSVEFVCSAAIPVVFTQTLALSHLGFFEYYFYMLVYVFFFMLDDMIIFGMAVFMLSGDIGEKYAAYNKIIGGVIMGALGLMLLFAPQMLG